jgi:hypothetical protein
MEDIDKYIRNHKLAFNSEEPADGHFDRFESRFALQHSGSSRKLVHYLTIAASLMLLVSISGLLVYQQLSTSRIAQHTLNLSPGNQELGETEQFYSNLIAAKTSVLSKMEFPNEQQKLAVLNDLKQPDDTYIGLQNDLKEDPNNEMVINALINYYEVRLNILNQLIQNLNQVLNNKQGSHGQEETII